MPSELPFDVPGAKGRVKVGEPDSHFDLEGCEQIETYYIGGPDYVIPEVMHENEYLDADAVTVVARQMYQDGVLVPITYDVTYWREVGA